MDAAGEATVMNVIRLERKNEHAARAALLTPIYNELRCKFCSVQEKRQTGQQRVK